MAGARARDRKPQRPTSSEGGGARIASPRAPDGARERPAAATALPCRPVSRSLCRAGPWPARSTARRHGGDGVGEPSPRALARSLLPLRISRLAAACAAAPRPGGRGWVRWHLHRNDVAVNNSRRPSSTRCHRWVVAARTAFVYSAEAVFFLFLNHSLVGRLVPKIFWVRLLIRSIKYRLIIKLITWMDGKSRGESIKAN